MRHDTITAGQSLLENSLRRLYGVVLAGITLQAWIVQANQGEHFNLWSDVLLAAFCLSVVAVNATAWLRVLNNLMLGVNAAIGLLTVLLLPLMSLTTLSLGNGTGPVHTAPWVYFIVPLGALSVSVIFELGLVFRLYLGTLMVSWQVMHMSIFGGNATFFEALQDNLFLFFLTVGTSGLLSLLRGGAAEVDVANSAYLESVIDRATVDSVEKEDQRINALIHDAVLNTFLAAAAAKTPEERRASAIFAAEASKRVGNIESEVAVRGDTTTNALFRALSGAAKKACPWIQVSTHISGAEPVPIAAATAITEAALQAIYNAEKHSKCSEMKLFLNSPTPGHLVVSIFDNGKGFDPERIPKRRVGIRGSIVNRMALVGGVARVSSDSDSGTTVILRWPE